MGLLSSFIRSLDDLIAQGYPPEVAERIVSGDLPMDYQSRMDRAGQRFDLNNTEYTGSADLLGDIYTPIWSTQNPSLAATYANPRKGGNITPVLLDREGVSTVRADGTRWNNINDSGRSTNDYMRKAQDYGLPSVAFRDIRDVGPYTARYPRELLEQAFEPSNTTVTIDPNKIRSVNAAFDPEYTGSNILGATAGTAGALGLLAAPEDAEAGFVERGGRTLLEAFHGSPYQFDRFDMSKIGTGEGAQAYGHGLYFADSEDVARGYRDALTMPRIEVSGKTVDSPYTYDILQTFSDEIAEETRAQAESWAELFEIQADEVGRPIDREVLDDWVEAVASGKDGDFPIEFSRQIAALEDDIGMSANDVYDIKEQVEDSFSMIGGNLSQINSMDDIGFVSEGIPQWAQPVYNRYFDGKIMEVKPEGALYRTEIDVTPESLLDYDMPLRSQPQVVQDAFVSAFRDHMNDGTPEGLLVSELLEGASPQDALNLFDNSKGSQSYRTLAGMVGGEDRASALLNKQGVRGIKFADGNSRKAKQAMIDGKSDGFVGDENYVIFDDSLINIAERGSADPRLLAGTAGAGLLGATFAPDVRSALQEAGVIGDTLVPTKRPLGERAMGVVDRILTGLEVPQRGVQGLAATGYGLLSGENFDTAASRGADVVRQGVDESARQFGDYVFDLTGSPAAATAAYTSGIFGSPL